MDETKITIAVCGDSFCSASVDDLLQTNTGRRAHFSQMLEDVHGYRVLYFAHGGFSNMGILFQMRQAVNEQAHVVVYNKTWSDRIELYRNERFNLDAGLENFFYYDPHFESTHCGLVGKDNSTVLSTTASNIEHSPFFDISKEQLKAIDLYFKYMYNDAAQTTIDTWLFEYWHTKIAAAGALPIFFARSDIGQIAYDFSAANPTFDTPFHTDRATQEKIAANIHRFIDQNLKLPIQH